MAGRKERVDKFLDIISMLESSGGKNFNHRQMESGIHKGMSAAGSYGIMPNTALEIVNRAKRQGQDSPKMRQLAKLPKDKIKGFIEQNPDLERELAGHLAQRVLSKSKGDMEKAAYRWFMGHNLGDEALEERNFQDTEYVKRFKREKKKRDEDMRNKENRTFNYTDKKAQQMREERENPREVPGWVQRIREAREEKYSVPGRRTSMMDPLSMDDVMPVDLSEAPMVASTDMTNIPMNVRKRPTEFPQMEPRQEEDYMLGAERARDMIMPEVDMGDDEKIERFGPIKDVIRRRR